MVGSLACASRINEMIGGWEPSGGLTRASQNGPISSWPLSCHGTMGSGTKNQERQKLGKTKERGRILWSRQENLGCLSSRVREQNSWGLRTAFFMKRALQESPPPGDSAF